jgi:hypothetical protein
MQKHPRHRSWKNGRFVRTSFISSDRTSKSEVVVLVAAPIDIRRLSRWCPCFARTRATWCTHKDKQRVHPSYTETCPAMHFATPFISVSCKRWLSRGERSYQHQSLHEDCTEKDCLGLESYENHLRTFMSGAKFENDEQCSDTTYVSRPQQLTADCARLMSSKVRFTIASGTLRWHSRPLIIGGSCCTASETPSSQANIAKQNIPPGPL